MEATIENTIGALEVGSTITTFLFGVLTLQLHTYFSLYKSDRASYKGIAVSVWFLDLVQTTIIAVFVYRATINNYGVAPGTPVPYPELGAATIVGSCIAALVQCFFAYRIWLFLPIPWRYLSYFCSVTALCRFGLAFWFGIQLIVVNNVQEFSASSYRVGSALFAMGAGVDGLIAVCLLWHFLTKKDGAFRNETRIVDRLLSWTVCTGLFTGVGTVSVIVLQRHVGSTLIWIAASFIATQLYGISLMSVLNSRPKQRSGAPIGSSMEQSNRIPHRPAPASASHAVQFAMPYPHGNAFDHGKIEEEGDEGKTPSLSAPIDELPEKRWN